jgi:hypothetical protein
VSVIALPGTAGSYVTGENFRLRRSETSQDTIAGITQLTSYPDRRWLISLVVKPLRTTNIRDWGLFAMQLSTYTNVFAYGPPYYSGNTAGYAGASPLVMGADQLGLSLIVDGLSNSVPIMKAGDFFSFDVTTALGNANRQLNAVTADVSSNGSGQATFPLLLPIRQAPADNAAVNITTPTAYFRFETPEAVVPVDLNNFAHFSFDAVERVFP